MESEITSLESTIRERDEQLSSFKTVLEEKEAVLEHQLQKEADLSSQLQALQQEVEALQVSKDLEIQQLQTKLSACNQNARDAEERAKNLECSVAEMEAEGKELDESIKKKDAHLAKLDGELRETKASREKLDQELSRKSDEVKSLSESLHSQKHTLQEKEVEISKNVSRIQALEQSIQEVQLLSESSREETDGKMAERSGKVVELKQTVSELQTKLGEMQHEKETLLATKRQLEEKLAVVQESVQQKEDTSQKELEGLHLSFSRQRNENESELQQLQQKVAHQGKQLEAVIDERVTVKNELVLEKNALAETKQALEQLRLEKESISVQFSECQLQMMKKSGALDFAQEELAGRDGIIKNLSRTLEEKNAAVIAMGSKMAQLQSEQADKLTEVMQRSEQSIQTKNVVETELRDVKTQLEAKEREIKLIQGKVDTTIKEKDDIKTELDIAVSKFEVLKREQEASKVESETLRGQMESLSEARSSLSQEQVKQQESLADLKSKLSQSSSQVQSLRKKLEVAKAKLGKAVEEKEKAVGRTEEVEAEIARHQRENQQMKKQFESAVKLMETKDSEQSTVMGRLNSELNQKESDISMLKEQLAVVSHKNSELKERVTKISADYKVSLDRCRLLENEKTGLQQSLSQLTSKHSHLEHTYSDTLSEREALQLEHQTALMSVQEHEARVLDLTDQLGKLAREKHSLETHLHDVNRQLVSSEQGKVDATAELERLREVAQGARNWDKERQVCSVCQLFVHLFVCLCLHVLSLSVCMLSVHLSACMPVRLRFFLLQAMLEDKVSLEHEKMQLQVGEAELKSQVTALESSLERLHEELGQSHVEVESMRSEGKGCRCVCGGCMGRVRGGWLWSEGGKRVCGVGM